MNGRAFFRLLRFYGISIATFAAFCRTKVDNIYLLQKAEAVPEYYQRQLNDLTQS
ncbi:MULTISPECIES: hypothetical protein [Corallincola]|uniref:hypothetical protein n=1 Tax=Corallincola TaxID=1775176 RepID=UPI001313FA14|nr:MULTISPECIES: hypothetical protein [Corallincola]